MIDRAFAGEEVVITRRGRPMVEVLGRALISAPVARPMTDERLDWLDAHRVGRISDEDACALVSRMRDEDWR